jgi:hypothetical protein
MTPDLIILGGGIAGLSAALGACDRGAFPLVIDAGRPPEPGRRFDLLIDDDFGPVGGPFPPAIGWACTQFQGLETASGIQTLSGHVVDRDALRRHLLSEAVGRGAVVHWQRSARWEDGRALIAGHDLPRVPVLLASSAFRPEGEGDRRRLRRCWQGTGTPTSSYLLRPLADGEILLAITGGNRWHAFGWQQPDAPAPALPAGARLIDEQARAYGAIGDGPLSGNGWLRLGAAAGLEPAHGFGLAARLALSRATGWLAAAWTLRGETDWSGYVSWLAPYHYWLDTCRDRLGP